MGAFGRVVSVVRSMAALSALAVLVGLSLLAATPALAAVGGSISGTVTAVSSHEPLRGIEVTVYEAGAEVPVPVGFASTNLKGEYTIEGLSSGSYVVEFSAGFEGEGGNYITQYYNDASSAASATRVFVGSGSNIGEINAALEVGGEIKGTVTGATASEDFVPLKGIHVTVYEGKEPVGFATTAVNGQYTVVGLRSGSYKVGFSPGFEGGSEPEEGLSRQNFIEQFYNDKPTLEAGETLAVLQGGSAREGVDAEMQRGAEIEGTVTDASTKAPVRGVLVGAIGSDEAATGAGFTNASGHYTIAGLPTGSYRIEFIEPRYITQYYNNQPTLSSANLVSAIAPDVTSAINAALVRRAPVNTAAPVASGPPAVGQTLSCTPGSWTGSPAPAYTYAWLRDGVPIAGATASTYLVQKADEGNGLTCKVTATNKSGSSAAVSNTLSIPIAPPPPPPKPTVTITSSKVLVRGGVAHVAISCGSGASCIGWVELIEHVPGKHRHGRHRHSSTKTVVVGKATYTLAAGHSTTLLISLSRSAARSLAHAKHHSLTVTAHAVVGGGSATSRSVTLSLAASRPAHKGHRG